MENWLSTNAKNPIEMSLSFPLRVYLMPISMVPKYTIVLI